MSGKDEVDVISKSRRELMIGAGAVAAASMALPLFSSSGTAGAASAKHPIYPSAGEADRGNKIVTKDGVEIFYKDWGKGQPIVFSHGWPLSADDWDAQMLFFVEHGYRVIAHDRRGHGRSTQTADGNDMNHYAADLAALTEALDIRNAVHIGHSTGGGEVAAYVARHGMKRTSKIVLVSAVPPVMVKSERNPGGTPIEVFDGFRKQLAANRAQFYLDVPSGPFYGFNRAGAKVSEGVIRNWWRQGMMGGIKAQYDCIKAFSETDFTEDLKKITQPALVLHGDDDQVVPYKDAGVLSAKLLKNATLRIYPGYPHGMLTTNADVINADILKFIKS
ncbi:MULTISPECIES: alpha/beta fold hydrolase [Burkholderia]|jgi:non-heme chloroperoxidase|uniref:Alpha/beta hydrolase n=1 Tax=Burkholderia cenocepacia TaxID=95486 RepID=A0A6B2MNG2_9BURK|nr:MULTISPECIES: alpha/beta hydrolase [Burkholderia]MBG0866370.1 alpha/beta hydrolase [Burkholderia sp. 9779_493]MBJ9898180.1 alpha/beta hydrolase [Burkholderia cenocepacia]MBJ9918701.1 alpha/beta hydrolase [Burkholderia cenocepacia]MBN3505809.1 alpha/beta hydrolase [Burkholderia cenocepacia]MBR8118992.1 alpha/beta hydrolase [Burkholderia cenocepacia]